MAQDGLLDQAKRLTGGFYGQDEPLLQDLQDLLKGLRIAELKAQSKRIAASNPQGDEYERFKQLLEQIRALESVGVSSL